MEGKEEEGDVGDAEGRWFGRATYMSKREAIMDVIEEHKITGSRERNIRGMWWD